MALKKAISRENKSFFQEKIEKNANNLKELWRALKSLGMKSDKISQSKMALKNDGAIQFKNVKNANIFQDFFSDLAEKLVRKLPVALNRFNNNSTKQYYMNVLKNYHNFELCNAAMETIKVGLSRIRKVLPNKNFPQLFSENAIICFFGV